MDRDGRDGRAHERGPQSDEQDHDAAEQTRVDHMRLLAMRKRQVQRKAARRAEGRPAIPEGGGAPLPAAVRARMEPELGADLSGVKVHTGGDSAGAAESLGARAFTVGSDVHFRSGEFAPGTKEGDRLLAHELTHVVQGQQAGVQRKADSDAEHGGAEHGDAEHGDEVSHPDEPAEKEADAVADHVADNLHGDSDGGGGGKKKKGGDGAPDKPAIAAKPDAAVGRKITRKIFAKWVDFKDLSTDDKKPTTNPAHPHLKEMGVTNLGPYKYFPAKGEFQYTPPSDLKALWDDTEATKSYDPEAPATPQAAAKPADKSARIAKAKQKFGPGIDAILAHDDGKTPRPFKSVADEDTRGAAQDAHNVQRHCLSSASEMKTRDDVALRAAFGMIGGVVKGVYTPVASAFDSAASANASIAGPLNGEMAAKWLDWRVQLAAGKNPFSPVKGAGCVGAVVFKSAGGAQLPTDEVPIYLGLDASHKGIRPLWKDDSRWKKWWDGNPPERKDYETKNGKGATPPPLTVDDSGSASGISMRVLADPAPTNGGWILHAAWPV